MSDFFLGEIRLFGFAFAPQGWHLCDGTILQITQNQALFALIGNKFGGDGKQTFALPDFRGRVPVGSTTSPVTVPPNATRYQIGNTGGSETVTLDTKQVPAHNHIFSVNTTPGSETDPDTTKSGITTRNFLSSANSDSFEHANHSVYGAFTAPAVPLSSDSISSTGGGAHKNIQPSSVMNFCIAVTGLFPPRN